MLAFVDHCGELGGGQVALVELLREIRRQAPQQPLGVVAPDGPLLEQARALGVSVAPTTDPVRGLRVVGNHNPLSHVVLNGLRWFPQTAIWLAASRRRRRAISTTYILHSTPGTAARRLIAATFLPTADAVIAVAASATPRRNRVPVPPLGITSTSYDRLAARPIAPFTGQVKALGRLDKVKGFDVLARALPELRNRLPHVQFRVAIASALEGVDPRYAAETASRLTPYLEDGARTSAWFKPGDVVVVPSRSEAVCFVAQEAMAAGALVVGTNVGDIPLLLREGDAGLVVKPEVVQEIVSAVTRAVSLDPAVFMAMARAGRASVAQRAGVWYPAVARYLLRGANPQHGKLPT